MFAYCGNNPVNRNDDSGQFWISALILAVSLVITACCLTGCSNETQTDYEEETPFFNGYDDFEIALKHTLEDVHNKGVSDNNCLEYGAFVYEIDGRYYGTTVYNSHLTHGIEKARAEKMVLIDEGIVFNRNKYSASKPTIKAFIHYHPYHNDNIIWTENELNTIKSKHPYSHYVIDCDGCCYFAEPNMNYVTDVKFLYVLP